MRKTLPLFVILCSIPFMVSCNSKKPSGQNDQAGSEWAAMKARIARGWNTWDTRSVLTHVHLPEGFSISLRLVSHRSGETLNEALPGRGDDGTKEHVIPGPHAWDGSYTEVEVDWQGIRVGVRSAAVDEEFFLQVNPLRQSSGDALVVDPQMLWDRPGKISIKGRAIHVDTPSGPTELAYANAIAITSEITDRGFVPNNSQPGIKSLDRSQPPVGAS